MQHSRRVDTQLTTSPATDSTIDPSPNTNALYLLRPLLSAAHRGWGGWVWAKKKFVYLKWASHLWLSIRNFSVSWRETFFGFRWVGGSAWVGGSFTPPPPVAKQIPCFNLIPFAASRGRRRERWSSPWIQKLYILRSTPEHWEGGMHSHQPPFVCYTHVRSCWWSPLSDYGSGPGPCCCGTLKHLAGSLLGPAIPAFACHTMNTTSRHFT